MSTMELPAPRYADARERGTVVSESGYHQPGSGPRGQPRCGCSLDTGKGAYRDVTVEVDGVTVHFYHQSPVVVKSGNTYRLDSHGYKTMTTKERISRYLPAGYRVYQEDFEWYVSGPDAEIPFEDGMTLTV